MNPPPAGAGRLGFTWLRFRASTCPKGFALVGANSSCGAAHALRNPALRAWGKRRNTDATDAASQIVAQNDRGYTGHEMLDNLGLIHMNRRVYDPTLARFISAAPFIQHPDMLASYNRYSYVYNTPLSATDPSGYFLKWLERKVRREYKRSELFRMAVGIGAGWLAGVGLEQLFLNNAGGLFASAATVADAGVVMVSTPAALTTAGSVGVGAAGGFAGGLVSSGGDLKAAAQGALTGGAFGFVGASWAGGTIENYAGHAVVGCASAAMGGGNCARGAASQVISKWVTMETDRWHPAAQMTAATVAGGTTSVITGGKFANGAQTAAFGYLFNYCLAAKCFEFFLGSTWRAVFGPDKPGTVKGAVTVSAGAGFMAVDGGLSAEASVSYDASGKACVAVKGCVINGPGAYVGAGAGVGGQRDNLQAGRSTSVEGIIMGGAGPAADVSFQVEGRSITGIQRGLPRAGVGAGGGVGVAQCTQFSACTQ